MAVRALKAGVLDIVTTPYRDRQLLEQIRSALDASTHS
jgi:FixJ family two-component response regulator